MTCKVRFMNKDDLPQVVEIDKEAFPTQWPPTNYRSELQNFMAYYIVAYREESAVDSVVYGQPVDEGFLARAKKFFHLTREAPVVSSGKGDLILGFGGCWIMADEAHITELAVRKEYRQQGVGQLLLLSLIELGLKRRAHMATLEVRVSNLPAQQLYTKFGFDKTGIRKAYYSDNREDAYIMTTPPLNSPEYRKRLEDIKRMLAQKLGLAELPELPEKR